MRLKKVNRIEANKNKNIVEHISLVKRTISHSVQQLQKLCLNYQWMEARYHEQKIKTRGHKMICHLNGITTEGWSLTKKGAKQVSAENMLARIEDWSDRDECKYGYTSLDHGGEDTAQVKIRSRTLKKMKENKEMSITEHIRKLADVHPVPQLQHLCQVYAWVRPQYQSSYENFKKDVCRITCTVNGFRTSGWGQKKRVAKFWAAGKMLVHLEENQDCEQFSYGYQVPLKIALEQTNVRTHGLEEISNVPKKVLCHSLQSLTKEEEVFENHSKESLIPESNGETNVIMKNDVDASSTPEYKKGDSIFPEFKEDVKIMKNYYEDARKFSELIEDAKITQEYDEDTRIFVEEGNVGLYPVWFKISPSPPGQGVEGRWILHNKLENTKHLTTLGRSNSRLLNEIEQVYLSTYNDPQEFLNIVIDYFCKTPLAVL